MKNLIALSFAFALTGCQAMIYGTSTDLNRLELGMSKAEVIRIMGQPVSTHADGDKKEESLIYKRMKHAISEWPRTYELVLREGHLIKWSEQYDEKNLNRL